ncbi:hypothetical protein A3F27_02835 [Candidatus Kaiserbacteria bacterium RIFCSPHIGHO2_12_FULL_53_13]|uniref:Uncharacterized protein n=1 Tax=Candidatus Kaiserbacteria bacterium RIFCSPHIGHO2_12_FULL_53_13 TaxID=1798502 RepID=A0A1F6EC28_9BACT|nr:MAG: hypothetical protein A3F27_02835 [Candidatus Kaiserbacteria bacterium RIFCSPHIGHO2_12_FULL_53_13]OGG74766.1 MAG: hypothetical protein A3A37_00170 [Candidatus Kaiserbacteria bacterium RIFCSPLOWO2_01_FULL_52_36]
MQEEILRLAKDNNRMLHSMRRNAFLGGIIKFIFYILILVVAPIWLYSTYLAPMVQSVQQTIDQVQGTGAKAQGQLSDFTQMLSELQSKLPSMLSSKIQ